MIGNRTRVLMIIPSLQGGGAERVIVSLLRHLDRARFRLLLAVVDTRQATYRGDLPADVEVIDLGCSRIRSAMPKMIEFIWKLKPDVVLSTIGHLNIAVAFLRPVLPRGIRFVARESIVVSQLAMAHQVPFWWGWAYRRFYNRFDMVVCQSRDMRNDLIENFGLASGKVIVINNPVDVALIRRLASHPVVTGMAERMRNGGDPVWLVAAGRLTAQKGFDLLIEALALCRNPRLRLTLLGEGPMRDELERLTVEQGVTDQVRFVGFQKNPYPFLAQADAFVLSSRFEGFPNVVLEALACGTPVVATPAPGGVREILDGLDGCVVAKSISAKALAEALVSFQGGYRISPVAVAPYDVESIVKHYEQVFLNNALSVAG